MKLSSISLIAAALAATAGSAIAVPRPLSAHALEQANLFQRDPDVHHRRKSGTVLLERRGPPSNAQAFNFIRGSASVHRQAATTAYKAAEMEPHWHRKGAKLESKAKELEKTARKYSQQGGLTPGPKERERDMVYAAEEQKKQ